MMLNARRLATLGAITAAAIVPVVAAPAAGATPHPSDLTRLELCHPKWVLGPPRLNLETDDPFDTIPQTVGDGRETVDYDDMTYNGC